MRLDAALIAFALFGPTPAAAQDEAADPMRSAPCVAARAELESLLALPGAAGERLEQARGRTARACLGAGGGDRQRSGAPGRGRRTRSVEAGAELLPPNAYGVS